MTKVIISSIVNILWSIEQYYQNNDCKQLYSANLSVLEILPSKPSRLIMTLFWNYIIMSQRTRPTKQPKTKLQTSTWARQFQILDLGSDKSCATSVYVWLEAKNQSFTWATQEFKRIRNERIFEYQLLKTENKDPKILGELI